MIPAKTPKLIKQYLGVYVWDKPNDQNRIYLTFDDGPIPKVTPWILDLLKKYAIQATFFCVGENISRYPDIFKQIIDDGHSIGNHTFNHLKGWKTKTEIYLSNVEKTQNELFKFDIKTNLFRPPYGKLKSKQLKALKEKGYDIIMWSILSKDYKQTLTPEQVLNNIISNTTSGSIIVCHDNIKAFDNLKIALPKVIEHLLKKEFVFSKL